MNRKLLALFLVLCLVLPLLPVLTFAEDTTTATYELVTSAPEDWSGKYLIVYKDGTTYYAMDSKLETLDAVNNYKSGTVNGNYITVSGEDDVYFTIAKNGENGYSIKSQSNKYVNQTKDDNGLPNLEAAGDPLAIDLNSDNEAFIEASYGAVLRFNKASNQMRFRFFKSATYDNQQAIFLYKLVENGTTPEPTVTPEPTATPEPTTKAYTLVTSESELTSGGTYLIVSSGEGGSAYALSKQNPNNRASCAIEVTEDLEIVLDSTEIATSNDDAKVFELTLEGSVDNWSFNDQINGYLSAAGANSSNYLRSKTECDDTCCFTITLDVNNSFAIVTRKEITRNTVRFNSGNNPPIFSCYATDSQKAVYLYKLVENTEPPATEPAFDNCSVVLSGQIGMNFYMTIPEGYEAGTLNVTIGERTTTAGGVPQEDGRYKYTCYLTSVEMADQITATYSYTTGEETKTINKITSIQGYLTELISNDEYAAAHALAKAIWNYGYYAQLAVADGPNHKAMDNTYIGEANLPTTLSDYSVTATLDASVQSATYSLTLDTETALNIYLTPAEGYEMSNTNVTVTCSNTDVDFNYVIEKVGNRYRVKITGIAAHELGAAFTVTTGDTSITASAMSYVQKCLASTTATTNTKNAAAALYCYYQEAIAYAGGADE